MTGRSVILDAGPSLNFLGVGQQDLLHEVLTRRGRSLLMPQTVKNEVDDKSSSRGDTRFRGCDSRLAGLIARAQIVVVKDDAKDVVLAQKVEFLTGMVMAARMEQAPDLGETMVIAHALKMRDENADVVLLIDEKRGRRLAQGNGFYTIGTLEILVRAAEYGLVENRGAMKVLYEKLSQLDDGLVSWDALPYDEHGKLLHLRATYTKATEPEQNILVAG